MIFLGAVLDWTTKHSIKEKNFQFNLLGSSDENYCPFFYIKITSQILFQTISYVGFRKEGMGSVVITASHAMTDDGRIFETI